MSGLDPITITFPQSLKLFEKKPIGVMSADLPSVLNCSVGDVDSDGKLELLICDNVQQALIAYTRIGEDWQERVLARNILGPCHSHCHDLDNDGDMDIAVASLGDLFPNDGLVGSVQLLEQVNGEFIKHTVLQQVRRVTDVQAADIDADGDVDLVVAIFGHAHGSVIWLECTGKFTYQQHLLHQAPGAIHVPIADFDNDGDLDIAACISQHDEEVLLFEQTIKGHFKRHSLFKSINYDLGISGLIAEDIDGDGHVDLLLTCGDNLENTFHYPQEYHGCYMLRNKGSLVFEATRISNLPGCYGCAAGDIDGDGDKDIALVSMVNNWDNQLCSSLVWLENDGSMHFKSWHIANDPIQLVSCVVNDFNGDGVGEIIAGALHLFPPYERIGRLHQWNIKR